MNSQPFPLRRAFTAALCFCILQFAFCISRAADPDLRTLLRDALFEEEATRDLTKAAAAYESLLEKWNEQRPLAASALFRLAEVRRKQDRKDDAIKLYQRLLTEFPDIDPHARLSRENLAALGAKEPAPGTPAVSDDEAAALARVQKLAAESPDLLNGKEFTDACEKGLLSVVKFLHSKGVRDNGAGMAQAAASGRLAICTELLTQSPPAEHLARGLAQSLAEERLSVFKLLLEKGGDASAIGWQDNKGGRPLLTGALLWENQVIVDLLLAHKAAANAPKSSTTPLFAAAYRGNAAMVKRLLELGADPNAGGTSPDGNAPPRRAGVGVSTPDKSNPTSILPGCTPLHAAVLSGKAECVSLLLAAKADPNAANEAGWTPLHGAAGGGYGAHLIEPLLTAGANPNGSPSPAGKNLMPPLWLAIDSGQPATVAALLKGKADPNILYADYTPAAHAITLGDEKVRDEMLALLLAAGADPLLGPGSAISAAPTAALKVKLLRSHSFPKLAEEPIITLSIGHMFYQKALALRAAPEETPASLPALLLAWNDKFGNGIYSGSIPDWSTLRLWRKGDGGKMADTVLTLKSGMDFPALEWGDIIEVLSNDWDTPAPAPEPHRPGQRVVVLPGNSSPSFTLKLPNETQAILRSGQTVHVTFKSGDFTRDLTLRGILRVYDPATTEAPLISTWKLVALIVGDNPGKVKVERSAARGGGVIEWGMRAESGLALPEEGDIITFTPDPEPDHRRVTLRIPGHPGRWVNVGDDQQPTLFQFLADFYGPLPLFQVLPPAANNPGTPRAAALKALTPDDLLANLIQNGAPVSTRPCLPWPDWSSVKIRRLVKNPGEPETINLLADMDLLAAIAALPADALPEDAREFDIQLHPGDEVELSLLKDHPAGPWPGFDEATIRFFQKALTANVTFSDDTGRFRRVNLQWLAPRWVPTPAGVIPIPDGDATDGRTHWLRARDLADSAAPGLQASKVLRDGKEIQGAWVGVAAEVFIRQGDTLLLAPDTSRRVNNTPVQQPPVGTPQPAVPRARTVLPQ